MDNDLNGQWIMQSAPDKTRVLSGADFVYVLQGGTRTTFGEIFLSFICFY